VRAVLLFFGLSCAVFPYSVLTHEAIIDSAWESHIIPALLKRFPNATPEQLKEAHAYVYGGCIIQDMGYVPFSSRFFSDLTHYARSGDFVTALLRDAQDLNEYAFALGSLAHYAADIHGHLAVNRIVPMTFPKVRKKFGATATYEDDPTAHIRTEFGLDVIQVARGHYVSTAYHDFVGFQVSKPALERGFLDTYGFELKGAFRALDLAIGTYRRSVGVVIPEMTKVAWQSKRDEIAKELPGITKKKYLYALPRRQYEKEWGDQYQRPGIFARILAVLFRLIPKVGPLKALSFKPVPPDGEKLFLESFNATLEGYRALLTAEREGRLQTKEVNLDTGKPLRKGDYRMADEVYAKLLQKLAERSFTNVDAALRADILNFFGTDPKPGKRGEKAGDWKKTLEYLAELRAGPATQRPPAPAR
jgi:hypothetical protein